MYAHAELAAQPTHRALQAGCQITVRSQQLQAAVNAWHRTDRHEPTAGPARQSPEERACAGAIPVHFGQILEAFAGRAMTQEDSGRPSLTRANEASIQFDLVRGPYAHAQYGRNAIDGDAPSPDPLLDFAS